MQIGPANTEDALPIADLIDELGYRVTAGSIRQKLAAIRDSADDAVLVVVADGRVVACIGLHALLMLHTEGKLGRITAFVVASELRSQGIGAALLYAAHRWFTSAGCTKFELTSADQRTRAHRFYESHGYRRDGQRLSRHAGVDHPLQEC